MSATVRNGFVWTCHHVGLSGPGGGYSGDQSGTTVDRTACGWYKLKVKPDNALSVDRADGADYGRIYDGASSNPYFYYMPSLTANATGDMVVGFSGSKTNEYIGAFYGGVRASGATLVRPLLVQAGRGYVEGVNRWGDYSGTSLDPTDSATFWTVQEFAAQSALGNNWATWVMKISVYP